MVDFENLVLAPCMEAFAAPTDRNQPLTWLPLASRPSSPPIPNMRGVWEITNMDLVTQDGAVLSSSTVTLGIRLLDWPWPPEEGDKFTAPNGSYLIDKVQPDGMGGVMLTLKTGQPIPTTG